jgi:hypothetical protein
MPPSNDNPTIEQLPRDPVIGDGVITLPSDQEKKMAAVDLPESVASQLLTESIGSIQNNNRQGRDTFTLASGALQAGIAKTLNELGPVESRAVSGVMATPVAGPTTAQVPG